MLDRALQLSFEIFMTKYSSATAHTSTLIHWWHMFMHIRKVLTFFTRKSSNLILNFSSLKKKALISLRNLSFHIQKFHKPAIFNILQF